MGGLEGLGWRTVHGTESSDVGVGETRPEPVDNAPLRESLRNAHREILRRVFLGEPLVDVAASVGMPPATVRYITRSPLFQAALEEMQREADGKVIDTAQRARMERALNNAAEEGIPVALKVMRESKSPATQAKVAFGFLDRAGMGPSRKVEERREGFREMLERLDEMERHMAPGTEMAAEIKFSVRKESEVGYGYRAGVSPANGHTNESNVNEEDTAPETPAVHGVDSGVVFLREALGGA